MESKIKTVEFRCNKCHKLLGFYEGLSYYFFWESAHVVDLTKVRMICEECMEEIKKRRNRVYTIEKPRS